MSKIMYMDDEYASGIVASFTGDLLVRERYTSESFTIAAYGTGSKTIDITKNGYTALGVVGLWAKQNANTLYYNFRLGSATDGTGNTTVTVSVKNHGNASINGQFSVDILYIKNLAVYTGDNTKELLWTNPSPASSYEQGNPISASIASKYDAIEISFMLWTGYQYICATDRAYKGERVITTAVASSNSYLVGSRPDPLARSWEFSETGGVSIYGGVEANFANNGAYTSAPHVLIPYKIYGIK